MTPDNRRELASIAAQLRRPDLADAERVRLSNRHRALCAKLPADDWTRREMTMSEDARSAQERADDKLLSALDPEHGARVARQYGNPAEPLPAHEEEMASAGGYYYGNPDAERPAADDTPAEADLYRQLPRLAGYARERDRAEADADRVPREDALSPEDVQTARLAAEMGEQLTQRERAAVEAVEAQERDATALTDHSRRLAAHTRNLSETAATVELLENAARVMEERLVHGDAAADRLMGRLFAESCARAGHRVVEQNGRDPVVIFDADAYAAAGGVR